MIDGQKVQSKASLWRMKQEPMDFDEGDLEMSHHQQPRGELDHVLSLDVGDGTVKK